MGAGKSSFRQWARAEWRRWLGEDEVEAERNKHTLRTLQIEAEKYKAYTYGALTEQGNLRKRMQVQQVAERHYHICPLAKDILEIADNLARIQANMKASLSTDPATALQTLNSVLPALEMTDSALKSALSRHGVEEFSPLGQPFDPAWHDPQGLISAGTVVQVHKAGVKYQSHPLRPAKVTIKS